MRISDRRKSANGEINEDHLEKKRYIRVAAAINEQNCMEYTRISCFQGTVRVICWVKKIHWNTKIHQKKTNALTVIEIEQAETLLFKTIQHEKFGNKILVLNNDQELSKKSKLYNLSQFLHASSITRVNGRLSRAAIPN